MKGMIVMIGGLWLKVPAKLFNDERMNRSDIAVFAYAADRLKSRTAELPMMEIAAACEISKSTVIRAVKKLCDCGYLEAHKRAGKPTAYRQCVLPAGKASSKAQSADPDIEKYKCLINNFELESDSEEVAG